MPAHRSFDHERALDMWARGVVARQIAKSAGVSNRAPAETVTVMVRRRRLLGDDRAHRRLGPKKTMAASERCIADVLRVLQEAEAPATYKQIADASNNYAPVTVRHAIRELLKRGQAVCVFEGGDGVASLFARAR